MTPLFQKSFQNHAQKRKSVLYYLYNHCEEGYRDQL